jgi:cyclic beta-1,2-glucan synthetase
MYRLAVEAILGVRRRGDVLEVDPCIPRGWPLYRIDYRYGRSVYSIEVQNPHGVSRGVRDVLLDGAPIPDGRIRLLDDGATHAVLIRLS